MCSTRLPLVVILGSTGSGKTKLSLELAKKFNGEIIGADSMQIYKGFNIITAKATPEELASVPHHLVDELEPNQTFNVTDFRNQALPIIDKLFENNKLPIVVGGTNYYIESLLWKILMTNQTTPDAKTSPVSATSMTKSLLDDLEHLPSPVLHAKLRELDEKRASQLHPNNKRKIMRSLEIMRQNEGRKHTDILEEQCRSEGGSVYGGGLRYDNSLIFWLRCQQDLLDERIDARTDAMLADGLVDELVAFHRRYIELLAKTDSDAAIDYTKGIFQTIGLKEFRKYLVAVVKENKTDEVTQKTLLKQSIEELKRATRRYAKKQVRWVKKRFLGKSSRQVPPVYALDVPAESENWESSVGAPAKDIVAHCIAGTLSSMSEVYHPLEHCEAEAQSNLQEETFVCDTCERVFVGRFQWEAHLQGHRHRLASRKKLKTSK